MGKKKTKNKKGSAYVIQTPWALVLLDVDGTTQKINSPNSKVGERKCVDLENVGKVEVEVLHVADTENNLNRYLENTWENSDRAYAIYKEIARRRKKKKQFPEKGYLAVSSSQGKKALVLQDINGITKIIDSHTHKVGDIINVTFDANKDKVMVEVLHIADTKDKLMIYLENIWEDSARAFAIYKEYTRRQRGKLKETDKYLDVMSSETQKQWALVLVDDDGTTRTMQSRNSVAGEMISDEKDQVKYEVLYVAETEDKLNVYLENIWEDSPRAFAIYKEYARKARIKPKQNKGSQKELLSVVNEAHTTTDQVKSKPNLPTTTEQIECKTNNHSTTEQVDNKSKTNTTTEQVESNKLKPERQSKLGYLKAFGGHLQRQKSIYGLIITVVLLFLGCDIKDIIEIFRLFDPLVSKKIYEVLVVLINKTDDG